MTMVFAGQSLIDMLKLYSTIIGNSTPECEAVLLFENLKLEANSVDPGSITSDSLTAFEAFLMVERMSPRPIAEPVDDVAGYDDTTMELSVWDPDQPVDDTNQYPLNCTTSREEYFK